MGKRIKKLIRWVLCKLDCHKLKRHDIKRRLYDKLVDNYYYECEGCGKRKLSPFYIQWLLPPQHINCRCVMPSLEKKEGKLDD